MRILVTGGAGFMGSDFIRYMISTFPGVEIVNYDALTYAGNLENLTELVGNPRYRFIKGDITDRSAVEGVLADGRFDAIVNFAAETHVDRSIADAASFVKTDVLGTHTLLEAVRKYRVPRSIHISTDEVFGSLDGGEATEHSPFEPNSPYAASKAGGDLLCRAYAKTYNTPVIVTHAVNNFGPHQYPEKVIPLFITNLLQGKKVPLYGDGLNEREWIFVRDHSRAIVSILEKGSPGEVYNIGTGWRISNRELTRKILAGLGAGEDMIEPVIDRLGHDRRYALNSEKIRALGWAPSGSFDEHLAATVEWYRTHRDWWEVLRNE